MQSASQQASILNKKIHRKKKEQESAEAISGLKRKEQEATDTYKWPKNGKYNKHKGLS